MRQKNFNMLSLFEKELSLHHTVSKLFAYLMGFFIIISVLYIDSPKMWNFFLVISMIYFLFVSKLDNIPPLKMRLFNTIGTSIIFTLHYITLGIQNKSALYIYFIGMTVLMIYQSKDILLLYATSCYVTNMIGFLLFPHIYTVNHSISFWFFTILFFNVNLILAIAIVVVHYHEKNPIKRKIKERRGKDEE